MSLNKSDLQRKKKLGDPYAKKVLKLRKNVNLLLCSLLLGNVSVNTAIPLYLDKLMTNVAQVYIYPFLASSNFIPASLISHISISLIAASISVASILIFGELIPQAVTARHALRIGAFFYPLMKVVLFIFWPISWPMSKLLDKILGIEGPTIFQRAEFVELIREHEEHADSDIDQDEEQIILGALSFSKKTAKEVMTPKRKLFFLDINKPITPELLKKIKEEGFTRIPVFEDYEDHIVGILYAKDLIGSNGEENQIVKDFIRTDKLFTTQVNTYLDVLLNRMSKKTHMAMVYDENKTLRGVITLEDILEEILDRDIVDETDTHEDLQKESKKIKIEGQEL